MISSGRPRSGRVTLARGGRMNRRRPPCSEDGKQVHPLPHKAQVKVAPAQLGVMQDPGPRGAGKPIVPRSWQASRAAAGQHLPSVLSEGGLGLISMPFVRKRRRSKPLLRDRGLDLR